MQPTYAETALNVSGQENDAAILYEAASGATLAPFVSPDVVRRQTPSTMDDKMRSTSPEKSEWPGVSTMLRTMEKPSKVW